MGWEAEYQPKPRTTQAQARLLCDLFHAERFCLPTRVLKHRLINGVWYAKVETVAENGIPFRWFVICLVRWEGDTLMRKMMDNSVGPCADDCPVSWFSDVPVEGQYDQNWRERCVAKLAKRRKTTQLINTLEAGDKVKFDTFYAGIDEWIYTGIPWLFRQGSNEPFTRLRNWRQHIQSITKPQQNKIMTTFNENRKEAANA